MKKKEERNKEIEVKDVIAFLFVNSWRNCYFLGTTLEKISNLLIQNEINLKYSTLIKPICPLFIIANMDTHLSRLWQLYKFNNPIAWTFFLFASLLCNPNGDRQSPKVQTLKTQVSIYNTYDLHCCSCTIVPSFFSHFPKWVLVFHFKKPNKRLCN